MCLMIIDFPNYQDYLTKEDLLKVFSNRSVEDNKDVRLILNDLIGLLNEDTCKNISFENYQLKELSPEQVETVQKFTEVLKGSLEEAVKTLWTFIQEVDVGRLSYNELIVLQLFLSNLMIKGF